MIERQIASKLKKLAATFPVVTIEGPRQSGKTTLAKMTFPDYRYANLEESVVRRLAQTDVRGFFEKFPAPAIIDEIQRVPELLSEIQSVVDEKRTNGQFILTGSHQPRLKEGIAQSLAGRTALLTLYPLSIAELEKVGIRLSRDELIFRGFLPAIYDREQNPVDAHEAYYRTYVERDVRELINLSHQNEFELFMRLLAGRVGQVVNLDGMSGEVGVSATTLKQWMSVLEASFVIFRLHPYYRNFGKRLVKSPKVYFTDVGLAAHLLGIESPEQVMRDPLLGGLFENLVVMEALKARVNAGKSPSLYYLRDKAGVEVDLVLESARRLHLMEIKSAQTPTPAMARGLEKFKALAPDVDDGYVVYGGEAWPLAGGAYVNFRETGSLIEKICDKPSP